MASTLALALLVCFTLYALKIYRQFARNLADAKASGITYTIVPFFSINRLYQFSCIFLVPLVRALPKHWTEIWFELTLEWGFARGYEPFKRFGAETFIAVSPERNVLYTAEAEVISQICTRRVDFPKPLEVYNSLKIYGNNVVTSEGQLWRHHRKITSPPFSEKNNHLVWRETLDKSQDMLNSWMSGNERSKTIHTVAKDAMMLSLHVISRAGFGFEMAWPGSEGEHKKEETIGENSTSSDGFGDGHTMSYTYALGSLLHNIIMVLVMPRFLLKNLPFQTTKEAYTSYVEWGKYMNEMFQIKKAKVMAGEEGDDQDVMIALVKGAGISAQPSDETGKEAPQQSLTDDEIIGNTFVILLAGHETTANSIHFSLVYLALNIASQRHLQSDLDEIFQGRPASQWDYDQDIPKLFGSMAGAVLNEELRLIAPVVGIPKSTAKNSPQPLNVGGKKCTVPGGIYIAFITPAVHRNPNQWPAGPPADPNKPAHPLSNLDNDLEEFKPERWLLDTDAKKTASMPVQDADTEASQLGVNTAADTSAALYRPPKGAYIPFSEGYRSCLGRRFAQVEILAFLALVFSQYSVELAVDEYATDEEVEAMDEKGRRRVWGMAKEKVERQMRNDMASVITLQLRKGSIGLRFVRRGRERFNWN